MVSSVSLPSLPDSKIEVELFWQKESIDGDEGRRAGKKSNFRWCSFWRLDRLSRLSLSISVCRLRNEYTRCCRDWILKNFKKKFEENSLHPSFNTDLDMKWLQNRDPSLLSLHFLSTIRSFFASLTFMSKLIILIRLLHSKSCLWWCCRSRVTGNKKLEYGFVSQTRARQAKLCFDMKWFWWVMSLDVSSAFLFMASLEDVKCVYIVPFEIHGITWWRDICFMQLLHSNLTLKGVESWKFLMDNPFMLFTLESAENVGSKLKIVKLWHHSFIHSSLFLLFFFVHWLDQQVLPILAAS